MAHENVIPTAHQHCVSACNRLNCEISKPVFYTDMIYDVLNSLVSYNLTIPGYKTELKNAGKYLLESNVIKHDSVSFHTDFPLCCIVKCEATLTGGAFDGLYNSLFTHQSERQRVINFINCNNDPRTLLKDKYDYALSDKAYTKCKQKSQKERNPNSDFSQDHTQRIVNMKRTGKHVHVPSHKGDKCRRDPGTDQLIGTKLLEFLDIEDEETTKHKELLPEHNEETIIKRNDNCISQSETGKGNSLIMDKTHQNKLLSNGYSFPQIGKEILSNSKENNVKVKETFLSYTNLEANAASILSKLLSNQPSERHRCNYSKLTTPKRLVKSNNARSSSFPVTRDLQKTPKDKSYLSSNKSNGDAKLSAGGKIASNALKEIENLSFQLPGVSVVGAKAENNLKISNSDRHIKSRPIKNYFNNRDARLSAIREDIESKGPNRCSFIEYKNKKYAKDIQKKTITRKDKSAKDKKDLFQNKDFLDCPFLSDITDCAGNENRKTGSSLPSVEKHSCDRDAGLPLTFFAVEDLQDESCAFPNDGMRIVSKQENSDKATEEGKQNSSFPNNDLITMINDTPLCPTDIIIGTDPVSDAGSENGKGQRKNHLIDDSTCSGLEKHSAKMDGRSSQEEFIYDYHEGKSSLSSNDKIGTKTMLKENMHRCITKKNSFPSCFDMKENFSNCIYNNQVKSSDISELTLIDPFIKNHQSDKYECFLSLDTTQSATKNIIQKGLCSSDVSLHTNAMFNRTTKDSNEFIENSTHNNLDSPAAKYFHDISVDPPYANSINDDSSSNLKDKSFLFPNKHQISGVRNLNSKENFSSQCKEYATPENNPVLPFITAAEANKTSPTNNVCINGENHHSEDCNLTTDNSLPSSGVDACKGFHSCQQDLIQETESKNNITQDADSSHSRVSRTTTDDSSHATFNDTHRSKTYNIYKIFDIHQYENNNLNSETTSKTEHFNNESVLSSVVNDVTSTLVENKIFNGAIKDQNVKISCSTERSKDSLLQNSDFITEAKDIYDPEWEDIRKLTTDEARYKVVKECWKSSHPPDPQKNLTYHSYRQKRTGNTLSGINIAGKKRTATSNPHGIIPSKCAKKGIPCTVLQDRQIECVKQVRSCDWNRCKDVCVRELDKIERNYKKQIEKLKSSYDQSVVEIRKKTLSEKDHRDSIKSLTDNLNHDMAYASQTTERAKKQAKDHLQKMGDKIDKEYSPIVDKFKENRKEVLTFNRFYCGLNNVNPLVLEDRLGEEVVRLEEMYKAYDRFYGKEKP